MCKSCNPSIPFTGYTPPPPRVALMAWVREKGDQCSYYAEIQDASAEKQTVWIKTHGRKWMYPVPFTALQSVALVCGNETLQAFGRPYIGNTPPAWVEFAEV